MDDIELDNLGENRIPEEEEGEEETSTDWRDESIIEFNPEIRQGLEERKGLDTNIPNPRKDAGVIRRAYTEDKKNLLKELGISLNKGDGPFAKSVFEKLKVTVNSKGKVNGAEFDGVKIIVQKGKKTRVHGRCKKISKSYRI